METGTIHEISSTPKIVEWEIPDYFKLPPDVDYSICSPEFKYLQYTCRFTSLPNGTEILAGVMVVTVNGVEKDAGITYWELEIRRANGTVLRKSSAWKEYGEEMVMDMFTPAKEIQSGCEVTGCLKIRCMLCTEDVFYDTRVEDDNAKSCQTDEITKSDKLADDLEEMFLREDYTDATIKVENKEFKVHKCIVGVRSPIFTSNFKRELAGDINGVVEINEWDAETFCEFLRYLYCGRIGKYNPNVLFNLLKLTHKYDVYELKLFCLQYIVNNLTVDTFCEAIMMSVQCNKQELVSKAIKFLSENMEAVKDSEKWQKFELQHPEATEKIMNRALVLQEQRNSAKDNFFQNFIAKLRGRK